MRVTRDGMEMKRAGFTLVELLVSAAVIGILVSIAAANLNRARIKAMTAQTMSDLRLIGGAIEAYRLDRGMPPVTDGPFAPGYFERLRPLTTPVAYIVSPPTDPFQPMESPFMFPVEEAGLWRNRMYVYNRGDAENGASSGGRDGVFGYPWSLAGVGPDRRLKYPYYYFPPGFVMPEWYEYNPSNGIASGGELFRRSVNARPR